MSNQSVNTEQLLKDMESGMTDSDLLEKHGFSRASFATLADDAIAAGVGSHMR